MAYPPSILSTVLFAAAVAAASTAWAAERSDMLSHWAAGAFTVLLAAVFVLVVQNRRLAQTVRERDDAQRALRAFVEASPAAATVKDDAGRYLMVNPEQARRWGVPVERCLGRTPRECLPLETADRVTAQDDAVRARAEVRTFEVETFGAGKAAFESVIKFPISRSGRIAGIGSIATDITARKNTERALTRTMKALRTLSAGNEVLVRARSERELLDDICRVIVEKGGHSFAYVGFVERGPEIAIRPVAFHGPSVVQPTPCRLSSDGEGGCPPHEAVRSGTACVRSPLRCPLGQRFCIDGTEGELRSAIALPLREDGNVFGTLTILGPDGEEPDGEELSLLGELANDLAYGISHLRAEARRHQSEETLRILYRAIDQSAGAVIITDAQGIVHYANQRLEEVSGFPVEDLSGRSLADAAAGVGKESVFAHAHRLIAGGREWTDTHRTAGRDGSIYWAQTSVSPVRDGDGRVSHFVLMHTDISERMETEKRVRQAEKMEALGNLAGGIAHDFNNMLLPIRALSKMVLRDLGASPQARRLEKVVEAAERAEELVRRILAFSRSGEIEKKNEDLAALTREAIDLLRATLPSSVAIHADIDDAVGVALVDRAQIQTVLLNLGANAAQAMTGRVGRLDVALSRVERAGKGESDPPQPAPKAFAQFIFADTGGGIDPAILPRIFEPFFTTKKAGEGTGLGLSMVHGIITEHGGAISVDSEVGKGTIFRIHLPLCRSDAAVGPVDPASPREEAVP